MFGRFTSDEFYKVYSLISTTSSEVQILSRKCLFVATVAMDSTVFVATLPVSQNFYFFSTGSLATNTALSVATVATNKHFLPNI